MRVSLVADAGVNDLSDENFVIAAPTLHLTAPLGGDSVGLGTAADVRVERQRLGHGGKRSK